MKQLALIATLCGTVLHAGCGGTDISLFPEDFDGTFTINFVPARIECLPGTAQVTITGLSLSGSGTSDVRFSFVISGALSGSTSAQSVRIDAQANSTNSLSFGVQMSGTAFKREGGVSLSGTYLDSNECDGNWVSVL